MYAEDFGQCMIATTIARDAPELPLCLIGSTLERLRTCKEADSICMRCPVPDATTFWLGFPFHFVLALGWDATVHNFPPTPPEPMMLHLQPLECRLHVQPALLPYQLRHWFLHAYLQSKANSESAGPMLQVEVQVEARTIWRGPLPAATTVIDLEKTWLAASRAAGIVPGVRVFSGPHPLQMHLSLGEVKEGLASAHKTLWSPRAHLPPSLFGGRGQR